MPSVMTIVSKAVFDEEDLALGDVWNTDRYASKHPTLAALKTGGDLYLVTVRPPGMLWLVAVLRAPKRDAKGYRARANTTPIEDLGLLRSKLRFVDGAPLPANAARLAMSLQTPRVLAPEDVELIEGAPPMRSLTRAETARRDKLLAMVHADPTNHDLRLVCADGLLELGDPRGELIAVQSQLAAHPADDALRLRERQLLKAHATSWLGPLAPLFYRGEGYRFARGFLDEVHINEIFAPWKTVLATKTDPIWSTVRAHNGPLDLALAPSMRALREIEYDGDREEADGTAAWRRLARGRWPFERVDYFVGPVDPRGALTALAEGASLPALRTLCIYGQRIYGATPAERLAALDALAPLDTGRVLDRLAHLELVFWLPEWELASDWAARLRPLFDAARVPTLTLRMSDDGPSIELRAEAGRYRRAVVEAGAPLPASFANRRAPTDGLLAILQAIPALRHIEAGDAKLRRLLKARGPSRWTIT